jgi:hypothetical protein
LFHKVIMKSRAFMFSVCLNWQFFMRFLNISFAC